MFNFKNLDGILLLKKVEKNSINLIITDPPYLIGKKTGLNDLRKKIDKHEKKNLFIKTEKDWESYKHKHKIKNDNKKMIFLKYGSVLGKKFSIKTKFTSVEKNFSIKKLEKFIEIFYEKLRPNGTLIIFFDLWKITTLKKLLEKHKFKQIRFIIWEKSNPVPLNMKKNYLNNAREIALTAVKKSKPTFNATYDRGLYQFPIVHAKHRIHPNQKNQKLIEELIMKHSNKNDLVCDPFLGSGVTLFACKVTGRNFIGAEQNKKYYEKIVKKWEALD